ncbi:MAG: hypothetical protein KKB59_18860 [Spirochaetes bacterium]|nr:hypothetical protein [Spirochaetota bacterium]
MKDKEVKRDEARERAILRGKRGPLEQLSILDRRFGKGVGAERERRKLKAALDVK